MCFLPLYAWVAPKLGFSLEYTEIVSRIWTSLIFWLTLLGIPVLLLTRDFAWKSCVASSLAIHSTWKLILNILAQVQATVPT